MGANYFWHPAATPYLRSDRRVNQDTGELVTRYVIVHGGAILCQGSSESQARAALARAKERYGDE